MHHRLVAIAHPVSHADVPSYTDARGFATFGMTAAAFVVFGWLILRGNEIPRVVGQIALLAAVPLLTVYFRRLIVLNPKEAGDQMGRGRLGARRQPGLLPCIRPLAPAAQLGWSSLRPALSQRRQRRT